MRGSGRVPCQGSIQHTWLPCALGIIDLFRKLETRAAFGQPVQIMLSLISTILMFRPEKLCQAQSDLVNAFPRFVLDDPR